MMRRLVFGLAAGLVTLSGCTFGPEPIEEHQSALGCSESKAAVRRCKRLYRDGRRYRRCLVEAAHGQGPCGDRDGGLDEAAGAGDSGTFDAAPEPGDTGAADAAPLATDAGTGGGAGMGGGDVGGQGGGTGGAPPGTGHGDWVCPVADDPSSTCADGSLLDVSRIDPARVFGFIPEFIGGPALDMNDSGDVLMDKDPAGVWLSRAGCVIALPFMGSPSMISSVAAINNRSSVALTGLDGLGGVVAEECNGTCRVLTNALPVLFGGVRTDYGVTAINDADSMVGFISSEMVIFEGPPRFTLPYTHAVVWTGGNFGGTDLGPVGLERSGANAISASDQIVGASTFAGEMHAALWTGGAIVDLGTLGGAASTATALNAAGQIVGDSLTPDATTHAFIWESGTMRDLGTLGGANAVAVAINSRGQVTGSSNTASGVIHAFIWEAGTMRDLGTLGGAASIAGPSGQSDLVPASQSLGADWVSGLVRGHHMINDAGQIAGTSLNAAGETHAFLWEAGTMRDLGTTGGTFSEAVAINASGRVAGNSGVSRGAAFVFGPGTCPSGTQ